MSFYSLVSDFLQKNIWKSLYFICIYLRVLYMEIQTYLVNNLISQWNHNRWEWYTRYRFMKKSEIKILRLLFFK